jgi:spectinomycin phosphotransferase
VYPFIEGQDGFIRTLTDEQWLTLGKTLKQVHEIDVPSSIQHRIRREAYSPKWREIVRSLYTSIESEPIGDEIALKLWAFMQENALAIHRLVNRAEQLAEVLQNQSPKFVLCHSDIHGGNVLMDGNNTIYIVDWDDPIMAPKERDLMFIGGGVANVWNKPHEEALFYKGYGKTLTMAGGENRPEIYKHFIAMFEKNGVVDIAFKTDESLA